jgi:hypothetical protein
VGPWKSRESRGLCIEGVISVTFSHFGWDAGTGIRIRSGMGGSLGKLQISGTLHRGGHFGNSLSFREVWMVSHPRQRLALGSAMNE